MKEIIIHAGSPKTGSSYLQDLFKSDRVNLLKAGILYPGVDHQRQQFIPESNVDINGQLFCHVFRRVNNNDYLSTHKEIAALFENLLSLPADKIFISDESLGVMNPIIWDMFHEIEMQLNFKLTVFSYYRKPDSYYPSHWSQVVRRHGEARSLIEFSRNMDLPIWRNMLFMHKKIENSFIFSYEEEKSSAGGLERSAYRVIRAPLPEQVENVIPKIVNPSLTLQALTAIRMVNEVYGMELGIQLNDILTKSNANSCGMKVALPETERAMLLERHSSEVNACSEAYNKTLEFLKANLQ